MRLPLHLEKRTSFSFQIRFALCKCKVEQNETSSRSPAFQTSFPEKLQFTHIDPYYTESSHSTFSQHRFQVEEISCNTIIQHTPPLPFLILNHLRFHRLLFQTLKYRGAGKWVSFQVRKIRKARAETSCRPYYCLQVDAYFSELKVTVHKKEICLCVISKKTIARCLIEATYLGLPFLLPSHLKTSVISSV